MGIEKPQTQNVRKVEEFFMKSNETLTTLQPALSRARKTIIVIGLAVFIIMGLFPPWCGFVGGGGGIAKMPIGYSFIFTPPTGTTKVCEIDISRLAVQWMLVVIGAAGFVILFDKKSIVNQRKANQEWAKQ